VARSLPRVLHLYREARAAAWLATVGGRLARAGFDSRAVTAAESPPDLPFPQTRLARRRLSFWSDRRTIRALVDEFRPDVLLSHDERSAAWAARLAGPARAAAVHGSPASAAAETVRCSAAWRGARAVVFPSETALRAAVGRRASLAGAARTVPPGVPAAAAASETRRADALKARGLRPVWTLGAGGRLDTDGGHVYLLEALRRGHSLWPTFQLLVFGEGPLRSWLEGKSAEYGLRSQLHFFPDPAAAADLLPALDLFVLPGLDEPDPAVLMGALSAGCPVAAAAVGSTPERVRDGEEGFLFPPRRPEAVEAALGGALASPAEARRRAANAGRRFTEEFDADRVAARWGTLLAEAAG
jgi:glycogen(starch) synthase